MTWSHAPSRFFMRLPPSSFSSRLAPVVSTVAQASCQHTDRAADSNHHQTWRLTMRSEHSSSEDLEPPTFYVGRDSSGRWIVQDTDHRRGGLFVSKAAAMKFARDETADRPHAIVSVDHATELDFNARSLRPLS